MALIDSLQIRLGVEADRLPLLQDVIADIEIEVKEYCNLTTLEPKHESLIKDIVVYKWNRLGSEGLSSEGYSGVSQSYIDGYTGDIKKKLSRYRRLPRGN